MTIVRIFLLLMSVVAQQALFGQQLPLSDALKQADQLFWLDNWASARAIYADAEGMAKRTGDRRNELYARISRLRADAERESYVSVLAALDGERGHPLLTTDPELRLRYYAVRGSVNMSVNTEEARADWEQVLAAAKVIRSEAWAGRAKGEMSICSFLAGDYAQAKALSDEALALPHRRAM